MPLKACGSNGWGQLGLASKDDISTFAGVQMPLPTQPGAVLDLASGSSHTLLLLRTTVPSTSAVHAETAAVAEAHRPPRPSPLAQSDDEDDVEDDNDPPSSVHSSVTPGSPTAPTHLAAPQPVPAPSSATTAPAAATSATGRSRAVSSAKKPLLPWGRNVLLATGTNTHGQLGPNCVLWNETKEWLTFKELDLLTPLRETLRLDPEQWHPVKVACTWSTSFVVYERLPDCPPSSSFPTASRSSLAPGAAGTTTGLDSGPASSSASTSGEEEPIHVLVVVGSNDFGERAHAPEFGGEINIIEPGERVTHLAASQRHVVIVLDGPNGQRVLGWGGARHGQLGHAQTITETMGNLTIRETVETGPDFPITNGDRPELPPRPPRPAATAADTGAKAAAGDAGRGKPDAKGKGKAASRPAPAAPRSSTPVPIPVSGTVRQVAVGAAHTLILTDRLYAFGSDAKGQIRGLNGLEAEQIAASWNGSYVLKSGQLRAQGADTHGQLCGAGTNGGEVSLPFDAQVKRIVAGSEHLLVVLQDGTLLAGGWNEHGNLGLGDERDRDALVEVPGVTAMRAWAGCATSFVV